MSTDEGGLGGLVGVYGEESGGVLWIWKVSERIDDNRRREGEFVCIGVRTAKRRWTGVEVRCRTEWVIRSRPTLEPGFDL